jgi:hypothetical protein
MVLLYLFFSLFLSRDRYLRFNRIYLVFSLIFSLLVPLISFPSLQGNSSVTNPFAIKDIRQGYLQFQIITSTPENLANLNSFLTALYAGVSATLLIRFLRNIIRLMKTIFNNDSLDIEGHKVVLIKGAGLPYSFFSAVYIDEKEFREGNIPKELLYHEFAHIDQRHSLDIVFIEALRVIFWFNPALLLYKKAILLNHEYLADSAVTDATKSSEPYLRILLNTVFRKNNSYLASSFNYSFTKKRLLMITKSTTSTQAIVKRIISVPFFILVGMLVLDAQEPGSVASVPPPPPPPPPFGYNTWWAPILDLQKVTPDPSKSYYTKNLFETGDQFIRDDKTITLGDAFILSKSVDNLYRIIRAKKVKHSLTDNSFICQNAKIETYVLTETGESRLKNTENYKDFSFRLVEEMIAPPPPPPPPPVK